MSELFQYIDQVSHAVIAFFCVAAIVVVTGYFSTSAEDRDKMGIKTRDDEIYKK